MRRIGTWSDFAFAGRVMYIELDDLEYDEPEENGYSYDTFFPGADEAAELIIDACNSGMNILCQCEYGQSRSAGCAAAIMEDFFRVSVFADFRYYPNKVVYHKMTDALMAHSGLKKFQIDERGHLLNYNGTDEDVVIPEGVVSISFGAFNDSGNLGHLEIPPDTYINQNAFYGTKWEREFPNDYIVVNGVLIWYKGESRSVVIPDNVKEIGINVFNWSDILKEVVIPKTVEKIDYCGFENCENLEVITSGNPDMEIEKSSFSGCLSLRRIICSGRSVLINNSKEADLTETVKSIIAFVRNH